MSDTGEIMTTDMVVRARGLSKTYGSFQALKPTDLDIPLGRIVGVVGANGAGKTTLLQAILGLSDYTGSLDVLGRDPLTQRADLMRDVCFIADIATLPKWMRVREVLDFVENIHPGFNRAKAMEFLARTQVPLDRRVKALSKGMTVQVHLAVVMAIDSKLLVLDEPTLGLDILFRKDFYRALLEEFFDEDRTILITTHQIEEVEHILSDVIFIRDGAVLINQDLDSLSSSFVEVLVAPDRIADAEAMGPLDVKTVFGRSSYVFHTTDIDALKPLGEIRRLGLADIFVAMMRDSGSHTNQGGAA